MSFTVRLGSDVTAADAGTSIPLAIEIANRSDERDNFELEIEGIDPEWTAVPVPTFSVDPHEEQVERVFFKPPRASESVSGNYPFVIKLRSLVSGEVRTAQGVLEVKPFNHLSAEINPKRGAVTPMRKQEDYDLTVMNLGNTEHTLQLFGNDPEDECSFSFEPEQVTVSPGQQKEVYVGVSLNSHRPFSGARLFQFSVSGRSIEVPSVLCSAQAQLERKPLVSPGALIALIIALCLGIGWWAVRPKPPTVQLNLDQNEITRGQSIKVDWKAYNADSVELTCGGQMMSKGISGEYTFTPTESGEVQAVAIRETKRSDLQTVRYTIKEPVPVPEPLIKKFTISPSSIKRGESAVITYEFNEAVTKATLEPVGLDLSIQGNTVQITPAMTGTVEYTIVAQNQEGKVVKKVAKVTVGDPSLATIVKFDADQKTVSSTDGKVTLTWQLNNAVRAEISDGTKTAEVDCTKGSQEFVITETTEFTLTGYDADGKTVTKKVKIKVETPSVPVEDPKIEPKVTG